jgi:hypothetical protein
MKKFIPIAILTLSLISCTGQKINHSSIESTTIENIAQGPIIHDSLSDEQLENITYIQKTFFEVYPVSLDETISNFKRDQNPGNEINIWLNMAETFQLFVIENSEKEKIDARQEAFKLILMRSMMSEKEAQIILSNYTLEAKPIKIKSS